MSHLVLYKTYWLSQVRYKGFYIGLCPLRAEPTYMFACIKLDPFGRYQELTIGLNATSVKQAKLSEPVKCSRSFDDEEISVGTSVWMQGDKSKQLYKVLAIAAEFLLVDFNGKCLTLRASGVFVKDDSKDLSSFWCTA